MSPADTTLAPAAGPKAAPPRRISEASLAVAIADWLAGSDFPAQDSVWVPYPGCGVALRQYGDTLCLREHPVVTRAPIKATVPGTSRADVSNARAVAAVVLRGDHKSLYGRAA